MRLERFFSMGLLLIALVMAYLAFAFNTVISYDSIGSKAFPILIFTLLALSLISITVRRNNYYELIGVTSPVIKKTLIFLITFLVYAYIFENASFPLASMAMVFTVGKIFNGKTVPCLITAIIMSSGAYLLFDKLLGVPLPLGPLS